jgi:hypothetical protein
MGVSVVEEEWVRVPVDDGLLTALARVMAPWTVRQALRAGFVWVIAGDERERPDGVRA